MTRRRLHTPGFSVSTKGHSVLRRYATSGSPPAARRSYGYGLDYSNVSPVKSRYYSGEEDYLDSQVRRATSIGSDVLYNTLDTANLSRNRDYDLMSQTNQAIPTSAFSAVKARLNRISSNLPLRRFASNIPSRQSIMSHRRTNISPIRDIDNSDTTTLVASPAPRPAPRPSHVPHRAYSTFRHSPAPDNDTPYSSHRYNELDTKDLVASAPPQQAILPHRLLSLGRRAGLSTPVMSSSLGGYERPLSTCLSKSPILDDSYPMIEDLPEEQSSRLLHGYISPSLLPKFGSQIISPLGSGTQTPILGSYASRSKYADIPSLASSYSPLSSDYSPELMYAEKQKHKVLGTKRHTGNYYDRLRRKRAGRKEQSKYWPYYDVDSIAGSDVSDVLSDDEYGASGYTAPTTYAIQYDDIDEDSTYVPFKPRYSRLSSPGLLEMSPYNESARQPDISPLTSSYLLPKKYSDDSSFNENDSIISSLVAKSVQKAKDYLKDVNWGKYENASLVFSIEGDMVHPDGGERYGFRYYPQPLSVHGGDINGKVLGVTPASLTSGDKLFFNYVNKMRDFRGETSSRFSDNLDTPSYASRYNSVSKSILSRLPPLSPGHPVHIPQTSYKKRLEGGLTHQLDVFPLHLSEQAYPSQLQLTTKTKSKEKHDEYSREGPVTVLDRILIKVNTETHSSPRAAVASLRARSRPQAQPASARIVQPRRYYQEVAYFRGSSAPPLGRPVVVYAGPRQSSVPRSSSPYVARCRSPSLERSQSVDRDYYSPAFDYLLRQPQAQRVVREARNRTRRPYSQSDQNYLTARYDRSIRNAQRALSPLRNDYNYDYVSPTRVGLYRYISPATSSQSARDARLLNYYTSPLTRRPSGRYGRSLAAQYHAKAELPYYELTSAPQNLYQNDVYRVLYQRPNLRKRKPRSLYAAIVASKLEDEPGTRRRKGPKSKFAADKYRATHKVGENPLYYSYNSSVTSGLTSSAPPTQKLTDRKAIRDVEGNFTKPRNLLSWQHRLEARVPPEEILYQPATFNRMRERLHDAQDKMDRHRQMLDRYIPDEGTSESIESRVNRKLSELEQRDASGGGKGSGAAGPPISETRRRIRRVLNGTRR